MKKHPPVLKLSLLVSFALVVVIVYGVCRSGYRAKLEKLNSLEPSTAAINTEVQQIQQDQDVIDQLGETDDETVIRRRDRMIDGMNVNLTKVNKDGAENQASH